MLRLLSVVVAAALVVATGAAILQMMIQGQPGRMLALVCGVALTASVASLALALRSTIETQQLKRQMTRLALSVDAALRDRPQHNATPASVPTAAPIAAAPERVQPSPEHQASRETLSASPNNVVQLANITRTTRARPASAPSDEAFWRKALAVAALEQNVELSLQPIISVSNGQARGFEVHRLLSRDNSAPLHVRRIVEPPVSFDLAAFDLQTLVAAVHTSRRRLSSATEPLALHVAVSEAFLASASHTDQIAGMLRQYPELGDGIVIALQAALLKRSSPHAAAVRRLEAAGFAIAADAEGVIAGDLVPAALRFVRIPSNKLIERKKPRGTRTGNLVLDSAVRLNVPIIAADVSSDDDAVALLDLGVDLMVGDRFSAPRRLKTLS